MKYAMILPDGAADEPLDELNGQTVLEAAKTPHMDWIAINGRQGRIVTVPKAFLPGSDVATLSVLGYDPATCYTGRAPLEAFAQRIALGPDDVVFRCNFVTIDEGIMRDFTAGHISQPEASRLINDLNDHFSQEPVEFFEGVQYRHLMVLRDAGELACKCTPPHDIPDQPIAGCLPHGDQEERVLHIMTRAEEVLNGHEVNAVRCELGDNPATHIWLWGQGRTKTLPLFADRFGVQGAAIAAVDLIRGITALLGFERIDVPTATGYLDTDYVAKGKAAVKALDLFELVLVHIEAPDEAGHLGDYVEKMKAIEQIDLHIVGPLLDKMRTMEEWKIIVVPDHPTPVSTRMHTRTPPPFCLAGTGVETVMRKPYGERNAAQSGLLIDPGYEMMEFFLRR
ncbi:MAG: cofactor-independent phosphoglycerate mutase [Planctomycetes bacterium]|nr:cofactor-independent phosphoglycerate mutase [Planctomycetota bacterium]